MDIAAPALDPSDLRPPQAPVPDEARSTARGPWQGRRFWLLAGLGALTLGAAAAGASLLLPSGPSRARLATVKMGPLEGLPEIKDGVPGLVAPKPVRVISTTPPGVAEPPRPVEAAAAVQPEAPSPLTEALSRPNGLPGETVKPTASATTASLPVAKPAAPSSAPAETSAARTTPAATAQPETQVAPDPQAAPAVVSAPPLPPRAPERAAAFAAVARLAEARVSETKPERIAAAPARPRVEAAPKSAPSRSEPPMAETAPPAEAPEEGLRLFGVTVVPSGRQIREAAQSFADTVTGLPGKF